MNSSNLQSLECVFNTSLVSLRRSVSREISASVSKIRQHFRSVQSEFDHEITRVRNQNKALVGKLQQMEEMIRGKEIEIYGLRHQLQSFSTGRGACSNCSHPSVATINSGDSSKVRNNLLKDTVFNPTNKRPLMTISSSISEGLSESNLSSRIQQPIKKRPCVLVNDIEISDVENINNTTPKGVRKSPSGAPDESQSEGEVSKSESTTLTNSVFPVGSLSPPSQMYDASLAIKNAINHNDLADYDATYKDSSMSDFSHVNNKGNKLEPSPMNRSGPVGAEFLPYVKNLKKLTGLNGSEKVQVSCYRPKRVHRPSCRYFHHTVADKEKKHEKHKSDDTGDDISLPSGFLESEMSAVDVPPKSTTSNASTKGKRNKAKSYFPSIGGSPTRDEPNFKFPHPPQRTTLVAKKPLHVANSIDAKDLNQTDANDAFKQYNTNEENSDGNTVFPCDCCDQVFKHRVSLWRHKKCAHTKKSTRRSSNRTPPSTPDGFWNLDLEQSDKEKENVPVTNNNESKVNIQYSSRRRRPLSFPSIETSASPIS
ncbi:unnamed protein product [Schistosoma turkestanicum]|nr:unnamed protein product [Schistosoma turkestanicum]